MIPVLSIHQPYASLITSGVKRWETRSWSCPARYVGRRIAIAATVKRPRDYWCRADRHPEFPATLDPFYNHDDHVDIQESSDGEWFRYRWAGPLGCILGTVVVARSLPITWCSDTGPEHICRWGSSTLLHHLPLTCDPPTEQDISDQLPYGYWVTGEWAWELTDPQPSTERCPWCLVHPASDSGPLAPASDCPVCDGTGHCDPIPVKGRQGIWRWDGTRRPT